ncbi:Y4yA family PLP-dependent enzyme [Pricia sp. S334]|uniref:Y4yA family PLP-dependent enzyme n=1 Tax=Pricia mediterranea TaxID=3076079 RepID=A0ABU3L601_9FLAO|nr:Y4yA family PLP-dependent enzyme [Pricia sp. S334]MDT7828668.1 Y4yA family PLP-dependent enzyme [Pricia sp. S334]
MKKIHFVKGNRENGLTPIISDWMRSIMNDPDLIDGLLAKYGSPINIIHRDSFANNISDFGELFKNLGLTSQIFYARKANKCKAFVAQALRSGIGVDTASERELSQSIAMGATGKDLVLTAAIKTEPQIRLAIENGVPIILDNTDECQLVSHLASAMGREALVGFRVSGFTVEGKKRYSRFGFDVEQVASYIESTVGEGKPFENLRTVGLHFHLDGYSVLQRSVALLDCISIVKKLRAKGYPLRFIDIGGGILINYLAHKTEWQNFDARLRQSVKGESEPITFGNNGLGYELTDGNVSGKLATYPYYNETNGREFLKKILNYGDDSIQSIAEQLRNEGIEIRIEPGRSLLDQTGITIARVIHRKKDVNGQWLVGLEMNMSQMMSSSADFLLDPYLIFETPPGEDDEIEVYFTGAYCLERDVLLKRKITLPKLPEIDDKVVFVNTAGYMMHFFETQAHGFDLARNLILTDDYSPISVENFIDDNQIGGFAAN